MDNLESKIERYLAFKGKPFDTETCVMETGISKGVAIDALRHLEDKGKVKEVRGLWLPIKAREQELYGSRQADFRFKKEDVNRMLRIMKGSEVGVLSLCSKLGWSLTKTMRALRTAIYLELVTKTGRRRNARYEFKRYIKKSEEMPWFWGEVAGRVRYGTRLEPQVKRIEN